MVEHNINAILVDRRNYELLLPIFKQYMNNPFIGIDIETHNANAIIIRSGKQTYLDTHRAVITGISLYPDGAKDTLYFNLNHADVENRLTWEEVKFVLDMKPTNSVWVAHNAVYEVTNFMAAYKYDLRPNIICTMQMAVSMYAKDNYDKKKFAKLGVYNLKPFFMEIEKLFANIEFGKALTTQQFELLNKFKICL